MSEQSTELLRTATSDEDEAAIRHRIIAVTTTGNQDSMPATDGWQVGFAPAFPIRYRIHNFLMLDIETTETERSSEFESSSVDEAFEPPSRRLFERLAVEQPLRLHSIIESESLDAVDLTLAATAARHAKASSSFAATLLWLLQHHRAIVREGAIEGLYGHIRPGVADAIARLRATDPSPGVREAAEEFLESEDAVE